MSEVGTSEAKTLRRVFAKRRAAALAFVMAIVFALLEILYVDVAFEFAVLLTVSYGVMQVILRADGVTRTALRPSAVRAVERAGTEP